MMLRLIVWVPGFFWLFPLLLSVEDVSDNIITWHGVYSGLQVAVVSQYILWHFVLGAL